MNYIPDTIFLEQYCPHKLFPGGITSIHTDDFFSLWSAWELQCGSREVPFWAIAWPAAIILAEFLVQNPSVVQGKKVFEIGCGGALPSITAKIQGARSVVACDIDPTACIIAQHNARANGVDLALACLDPIHCYPAIDPDVILLADMFYIRSHSAPLHKQLCSAAEKGSKIFISDASRPFTPKSNLTLLYERIVEVSVAVEGVRERKASVYEWKPG